MRRLLKYAESQFRMFIIPIIKDDIPDGANADGQIELHHLVSGGL